MSKKKQVGFLDENGQPKKKGKNKNKDKGQSGFYKRCYEDHPQLSLLNGTIIGGSCSNPMVKDADVYVGLDYGMTYRASRYPWRDNQGGPIEFLFRVTDMSAPSDPNEFKLMVDWIGGQLEAGKRVHIGCIGGHGRTGTLIAALVAKFCKEEDAIAWVREHYCKKAVESKAQIDFLKKYYFVKDAIPTKSYSHSGKASTFTSFGSDYGEKYYTPSYNSGSVTHGNFGSKKRDMRITCVQSSGAIW